MIERGKPSTPTVLVVDDEPAVVESLADLLRREFHVLGSTDPLAALDLLGEQPVAVVLADQRMPELTGSDLLTLAAQRRPHAARILVTGYSDIDALVQAVNEGRLFYYVTKPWDSERLLELVRDAAARALLLDERQQLLQALDSLTAEHQHVQSRVTELENHQQHLRGENETLQQAHQALKDGYWHLAKIKEVLPICMECGRVLDERDSWVDVVAFLRSNSTFLTHGYCPDCFGRVLDREGLGSADDGGTP